MFFLYSTREHIQCEYVAGDAEWGVIAALQQEGRVRIYLDGTQQNVTSTAEHSQGHQYHYACLKILLYLCCRPYLQLAQSAHSTHVERTHRPRDSSVSRWSLYIALHNSWRSHDAANVLGRLRCNRTISIVRAGQCLKVLIRTIRYVLVDCCCMLAIVSSSVCR